MSTVETPKVPIGLVDGRYVLAAEIRQGGMSTVQKAYDPREERLCAIKRMKGARDDLRWKESFNREQTALSDLISHPNIVSLYDAGVDDDGFYMVLEWMPLNLLDWIKQKGALSWAEFYPNLGKPLLEAIAFAQGRGWSHRDIKPSNILLSTEGIAKIGDYGIAKQLEKPSLGLTFAQFRSVPFSPPEDDVGDLRSTRDCFSWAAVAVFCLTAKLPTDYGALAELTAGLDRDAVPAIILQSALSDKPEERPPLASALLAEMDAFEVKRLANEQARRVCHIQIDPAHLQFLLRTLDAGSQQDVETGLLDELTEVQPGWKRFQLQDGKQVIRIFAVTWTLELSRADVDSGRLIVRKAWQARAAEVERLRNGSFRPTLTFTFNAPRDRAVASNDLDTLFIDLEAFEVEERGRVILARRERIFRIWYAFLRSKADFEARRENAIAYIDAKISDSTVKVSTELPASIEVVGQSRIIRLPSGGHIFCDVVDVNLDEVIVHVTFGDLSRLPKRGRLEVNTLAAEKSIERQRSALDAVNFDRSASSRLKAVIVEPTSGRPPVSIAAPIVGGGQIDSDKKEALRRALGLQDVLAIQGPPGTGKTRLIEEIIVQYLNRYPHQRVLVSSQTHVALDNVIERIRSREPTIDIVRIGRVDDPKISAVCRELVLDRKAQVWSEQVRERAHRYMTAWAQERGIDRSSIEIGMMVERLIRLLGQVHTLEQTLSEAEARIRTAEERAEQKLTDTGSAQSAEIERAAVEAQEVAGVTQNALVRLRTAIQEVRDRLRLSGGYGPELAEQDTADLKEWSPMLLGHGENERRCRDLLELQEDWMLRVGRSSDFHAAMLASAQVVAGTCIGMAGVRGMNQVTYDLCIVDEASKATATEILVPMSRSRKWILVGDPAQLPPFFEDESITRIEDFDDEEVRRTLLDRFLDDLPEHSVIRLRHQYRMVKAIGDLISESFYAGALESPKTTADVTLTGAFPKPVTWVSTTDLPDAREIRRGASYYNDAECRVIRDALAQIDFIARKRKATYDVALIAGYVAQVKAIQDIIRDRLHEWPGLQITCSTVDAFQGSEAEICIYSVTRSNPDAKLGFLREKPRLNVALSRGRSALIIVGDDAFCRTAAGENPFRKVLDFIDVHPDQCERRAVS